jgi:hypothetical protein
MSQRTSQVSSPRQSANGPLAQPTAQHIDTVSVSEDAIAKRAYEKFMARGCSHGLDQEDWAGAEQELNAETSGGGSRKNKA